MNITRPNINLLLFFVVIFSFGSCNVSKYLDDDEYLVKKNKIIIDDKAYSKNDPELIYNLESLLLQKPNRDYFFIPREWLYYRNKEEFENTKKKKGWVKNAERPVIHADQDMFETAVQMEKYLRFSKGYYNAKVYPQAYLDTKKAEVHYYVTTEKGYTVRSKEYFSKDTNILKIIDTYEHGTFLKEGTAIDESIFDSEKNRIATQIQELGYANFGKNNIDFKADSFDLQMDVFITILPPENDSLHRQYSIGKINVYPDYKGIINKDYKNVAYTDSIQYYFNGEKFFVKPKTLERALQFRTGQQFKKSRLDDSYTALANLGTFRYISISSSVSPVADTIIDYNILLTPVTDQWAVEGSLDLFYSSFAQGGSRLGLGTTGNLNNINAFGGGEKFRIGTEISGESRLDTSAFTNFAAKLETGLTFPTIIDPIGHYWLAKLMMSPKLENKVENNSVSDTELSYSYISTLSQYNLHSIKGDFHYEFSPESKIRLLFRTINLNSISSKIDPKFEPTLDENQLLRKSLDPALITGFIIQEFQYSVDNPVFSSGFTWAAKLRAEQSGLEIAGINWLIDPNTEWVIDLGSNKDFRFSKYLLGDIDLSAEQRIRGKHRVAGRIRTGIGSPIGKDAVIPFIKQFYVGGANSLRGWNTRQLGPGSYADSFIDTTLRSGFFQSGDIVLEANLEYRFPLYYVFEGAVFMDAGNVWTLREDVDRPGSQFLWDEFYNQIAVNYGFGIRMNLDFIVLRFDFGQKLRYPFQHSDFNNEYWITPKFSLNYLRQSNFVFGLNYPF